MTERSERPPYVSFFPSDWKGGTQSLPMSAEWTYFQVCMHNWDKGEPLPEKLHRMTLGRNPDWAEDIALLLDIGKIVKSQNGGLWSKRALIEAENAETARNKRKKAGKKGANSRWNNNDQDAPAMALPSENDSIATENACDANGNQSQNQNQSQIDPYGSRGAQGDFLDQIDPDIWKAFAEHRIKLKAPLTERAGKMIRTELTKLYEECGHPPNRVLQQSIMRGWKGVFPLKDDETNGKRSGWRFDDER